MHHGRLQDAPFHPVLGRTGGIQKTAMGSQGSQVKFGRSQSRKVISESHESPNVQHWRNLENVSRRNSTYITYKKRQKFIKTTFKKMAQKVLDGVGLELATHRATPPGDPGLQSLRNIFSMPKCRHRNSEFRKSTKSSNLQVQPQSGLSFRFFSLNLKKTNPNPMEFSRSTRLAIQFNSSTSRLAVSRLRMNITQKDEKKQDKIRVGAQVMSSLSRTILGQKTGSVGSVSQLEGVELNITSCG